MRSISSTLKFCALAVAFGVVAACSSSHDATQSGNGAVRFVMSASATSSSLADTSGGGSWDQPQLQAANVTFASILARNLDGQLINVTIDLPITVDLLGLVNGGTFTLPDGFLPPGTYDQIVIVMTEVQLTLADGTVVTIDPPGGGWTAILPVSDTFEVVEGQETTVMIDFRAGGAFRWLSGHWEFHPDFHCSGHHRGH
jgi:hypothetical protein